MDNRLGRPIVLDAAEPGEPASLRLRELEAVLLAIDEGELLASLPLAPWAAARHQAAVSLLAVLRRELGVVIEDLERAEAGLTTG